MDMLVFEVTVRVTLGGLIVVLITVARLIHKYCQMKKASSCQDEASNKK